jgi:hypothetical protein
LIYEYTKQDIPRAWKAGYSFVQNEVARRLIREGTLTGADIINEGSDESLWYRSAYHPVANPVSTELLDPNRKLVVREGQPLGKLSPTGRMYNRIYETLFSGAGLAVKGYNLTRADGDAFTGFEFPSQVVMPEGVSGRALYRNILQQMTPVMSFQYLDPDAYPQLKGDLTFQELKYGELGRAQNILHAAGHEFAHATMQIGMQVGPSDVRRLLEDKLDLASYGSHFGVWHEVWRELHSDVFSTAVSLNPRMWTMARYSHAVMPRTRYTASYVKTYTPGEDVRLRVFSPSIIDDPDSPLYRKAANIFKTGMQSIESPLTEDDHQMSSMYYYAMQDVVDFQKPNYVSHFGTVLGSMMRNAVMAVGWTRLMEENPDVEALMSHVDRRTWGIPYVVAKARPDLIGKEIRITPQGDVLDPRGQKLDLAEMLPDLPITGILEPEEVPPVVLERAFRVQDMYNRARDALRSGYRFEPPPVDAAEVIDMWRQEFRRVVGTE